ncbi:MAG: uroporphyrinogen decarboxylase family protein [Planctomycetota bacterium]
MNPREIVLAQIRHRETPVVPYTVNCDNIAAELDAHYGNAQWRDRITPYILRVAAVETGRRLPTGQPGYERDPYGSEWRVDRLPFHLEIPALPKPSFKGHRWPKPEEFFLGPKETAEAKKFCREHKGEHFLRAALGWGLFESSWGLRGFENVLFDVVAEVDFYEELLDRITDQFLAYIEHTCATLPEADAIMFGDDWGDQRGVIVGPDRWRQLFKPRYAKLYAAAHKHGKLVINHSCGSIIDIIPDLIEIGLDVMESVQPEARDMNPYALKKQFGDKIAFWGCLGSQLTLAFGTPAEVKAEVRHLRKEMAVGGGYILAPAKPLQQGMPIANAAALLDELALNG